MATDAVALSYLGVPWSAESALATLAEPVQLWFRQAFGNPTLAQRLAWPALMRRDNLLISSPTGSGKTLAAFAPILSRLLTEPESGLRCLYVAPLKALGSDARRNLRRHLKGIRELLPAGTPPLRVGLRTGDTPARLRRRLMREPPHILLTTPESLALMLLDRRSSSLFQDLRWVIVDELHALAGSKRGADLTLSLERLERLRPPGLEDSPRGLQRVGLSATCATLTDLARFLVGVDRPCSIANVPDRTPLHLRIEPLPRVLDGVPAGFINRLCARLEAELEANLSTLIFTNVRSLAERLTWALRRRFPERADRIAVHHSSLAAARRRQVERRLKQGKLWAVVSSTSLELGVDMGSVAGVVLVHPPGGVVRLLQRVGRAGHCPQRPRRGLVLTDSAAALLEAAVTGASSRTAQLEKLPIPEQPLDVLCQQLLGLAAQGWTCPDDAFRLVRRAYPYRNLCGEDLTACLAYLSGQHADGREWLPPRLRWEEGHFTLIDDRTLRLLRRNLGTIVAEENRAVRIQERRTDCQAVLPDCQSVLPSGGKDAFATAPLLGEVAEGFADGLQPGDRFVLDGRCLEYEGRDGSALLVTEVAGRPRVPRWIGSGWPLAPDLARRIYVFRIQAAEALRDGPACLADLLRHDHALDEAAIDELVELFTLQESLSEVPDQNACLIECVRTIAGADYYMHTPLNRAGNDALARVATARLVRQRGLRVSSVAADLGVLLSVQSLCDLDEPAWRAVFAAPRFHADLERAVAESETLRERFREAAFTGLMLLRNPLGRRRRVGGRNWAERRLFEQVIVEDPDFVLLRQARRDVHATCDAAAAEGWIRELERRPLRCRWLPHVSPLAESWTQPLDGMAPAVNVEVFA